MLQRLNDDFISKDCKTVIDKYHDRKTNISHAILASTEDDDNNLKQFGLRVSTEAVNFLAKVMKLDEFMSLFSQCLRVAEGMADKTLYSECLVSIGFKQLCYYGYKDAYRTDAKRSLQEAHDLQTRLVNYDSECKGHCKCKLGLCCFVAGDRKKGISLIAQGIGMRKRLVHSEGSGKMERMLLADGFCDLAMAMFTSGKYKAAVNIWTNLCLVRYRELLGTHPFTASLLHYIGDAYQKLGDPKRAVAFKKESLAMRRSLLGVEHLDTARAHYGVGCALGALGSTEGALEHLSRAYEIQKRFHASKYDIEKTEQEINWFTSKNKSRVRTFCFLSWYRGECLGAGRFGKVFRCITWNDEIFAVKIVKMKPQYSETQEEVKALQNEISILKKLTHERIVSYHGSEQKDGHLHLFMDFMAGGSLSAYIKKSGVLSEDESRWYTNQMLQGIEFLHLLDVIHRDIKGSNVLLDGKGNVKLADFGSSKMIQKVGTKTNLESYCGTPYWMAPEILWGEGYGRKADIWSLGCTVVEMLTGKPPLGDMEPVAAIFKIGSQPTEPTLPETASQDAKDFIKAALAWKPEERPWSGDLQRYKFVSKRR